jgi:aspartyl protease family protein
MKLRALLTAACALVFAGAAQAQNVALTGVLGSKALLVVDGAPPKAVGVGETWRGVKVVSTQSGQAVIEVDGSRQTLVLGGAPVSQGGAPAGEGDNKIVLHASGNGHFVTLGQINGRSINFMVDTGASYVSVSASEAERLGINLKGAQPIVMGTANGSTQAWRVKLSSVRIGNTTVHEVDAVVMPASMPVVLLGNSYLSRFQMTRTNEQLVLERRY